MKKTLCLFLAGLMLFLMFSCSRDDNTVIESTATTTEEQTAPQTTLVSDGRVKADGFYYAFLPESFPDSLPDTITVKTTTLYSRDDEQFGYNCDFVRLRLTCNSDSIELLSNMLKAKQWPGDAVVYSKDDDSSGNAEADWIEGSWCNGEYCALVSECVYNLDDIIGQPFTLSLDVLKCDFEFPQEISAHFPAFDGYCINSGTATVLDKNGNEVEDYDNIDSYSWRWDFSKTAPFVGVSFGVLDDYVTELDAAGFETTYTDYETAYGNYVTLRSTKEENGVTYYIDMLYLYYLNTLSICYTNDYDAFA